MLINALLEQHVNVNSTLFLRYVNNKKFLIYRFFQLIRAQI